MDEHIDGCVRSGNFSRFSLDGSRVIDGSSEDFLVEQRKRIVGIVGLGSVGSALRKVLGNFYTVAGYDIKGEFEWEPIIHTEFVFICVQTPGLITGRLDCSHVEDVIDRLSSDHYRGIVIIKSTLKVGFSQYLAEKYTNLRIVYSPEFMSERNAFSWTANPDRLVIAGNPGDVEGVKKLYFWANNAEIILTDFKTAEIGKLAHNSFIALKVTFTNTMENVSDAIGANVDEVMHIVYSDRRVRNSAHLTPHMGPYGGKCVPKDTSELINAFPNETRLLKVADEINDSIIENTGELKTEKQIRTVE